MSSPSSPDDAVVGAGTLEQRIQCLEDVQAIKDLVFVWSFHVNKGSRNRVIDLDALRSIYADDVVGESPALKMRIEGIDSVLESVREETAEIAFSMHALCNPVIRLEGDRATGDWVMWIGVRRAGGFRQIYANINHQYVRSARGWRIKGVRMDVEAALQLPLEFDLMASPRRVE
jgi:hypothetical protein